MSIRARVVFATVALAALAVVAADAATFVLLRRYFDRQASASVRQVEQTAVGALRGGHRLSLPLFAGTDRPVLVELVSPAGRVLERLGSSEAADVSLPPDLRSHLGHAYQLDAPNQHGPAFEAIAAAAAGGTVIAVVSLKADVGALADLFGLNLTVGGIVLVLLAAVATVVLTRSLRPLRRIATTADAIAGGDLAARMPPAPRGTEIGRVATALNKMLVEIDAAFAQRDETEERLRQFLADASHELRTPLTSIRGYAELFRRGASERPEDLERAMRAIEEEAARMSSLVEDLLLLAQLDDARPLERAPVALDDLVEAAVDAARVVEPERSFQFEFSQRPLVIDGDKGRLRQVLDNLLANVRQHTPPGSPAYISLRLAGDRVVMTVEDTGPGIDAADHEHVFGRFSRSGTARGRATGGAGLGLAIVRSIIKAHGGVITVRAAAPHGTIFEIRFPREPASSRGTPS